MHRNCAHCLKEIGSEVVDILNLSPVAPSATVGIGGLR
jgi:hypothetical protein